MKIPSANDIVVPRAKLVDYLLSTTHSVGRHKATFFTRYGFRAERWQDLAAALVAHAREHEIASEELSPFGRRLVAEGIMETPDGRRPMLRSIWFLRDGETVPRFVTAYPIKQRGKREPK
jgi:hypothetical protein